jgi:AmmeMemoRadiSam system protein B/AmmeMemoRadiSam system protein A
MKRLLVVFCLLLLIGNCFANGVKEPNVADIFYPKDKLVLSELVDRYLAKVKPQEVGEDIFGVIVPHAGYGFSGETAAYAYALIKGRPYRTVVVIGPGHHYGFDGISVYPAGYFRTPLGDLMIDSDFAKTLISEENGIAFIPDAFEKEHSIEVQLPFLQRVLKGFKVVPVVMGDCSLESCKKFAQALKNSIGKRKDILIVVSTDLYHGYDWEEAELIDSKTLKSVTDMESETLYYGLRDDTARMCGGFGVVSALILAKELHHNKVILLNYTNSARVSAKKEKGLWTVGYASLVIDSEGGKENMLNNEQRKKLLEIARNSIETYLATGKRLAVKENDQVLNREMGAFVTLNEYSELRGCIGSMIGTQPLYLTIRDMAIEAATGDPRFTKVKLDELKSIEIEISVLSPMERVKDVNDIKMGVHGVMVKKGFKSGVFLPQVATETGWSREEFLSNLCAHKAGLPADAWKDKNTELLIFSAEVFSEKDIK